MSKKNQPIQIAFGAIPSPKDVRDFVATAYVENADDFPDTFQVEHPPIKNQQATQSCVAHALASVVEYFNKVNNGSDAEMSTEYIYGDRRGSSYTGPGMVVRDALKNLRSFGTVPYTDMPQNCEVPDAINNFNREFGKLFPVGCDHRISEYYRLNDTVAIKSSLIQGDIVVIVLACKSGMNVSRGILQIDNNAETTGYHCMYLYGWNKKGWLVANSWGAIWGSLGCCTIPYDVPFVEAWGLKDAQVTRRRKERYDFLEEEINRLDDEWLSLWCERDNISEKMDILLERISEVQGDTAEDEEALLEYQAMIDDMDDQMGKLEDQTDDIEEEISKLYYNLTQINKPYKGWFAQLVAKVVNFINKIFKKGKKNGRK